MYKGTIDLGQIIISVLIAIVGYFVKRTIEKIESRVDEHEVILFKMHGDVKEIKGILGTRHSDG